MTGMRRLFTTNAMVFSKSVDEAKDLTQDVFLHLYLKLPTFKAKSKFSTWLYALTYNYCTNYVNRDKGRKIEDKAVKKDAEDWDKISIEVKEESLFQMRSDRLKKALKQITAEDRVYIAVKISRRHSYQRYCSLA